MNSARPHSIRFHMPGTVWAFVVAVILLSACKSRKAGFMKLSPEKTGITFTNTITESDSINIFDFANIYNGGGVGVGDFNNDGLQDLYFTGNMVPNKLYLNKGGMQFQDITTPSGTNGGGIWSRGVAVVDINNDGLLDMYVCATAKRDPMKRINVLYVNQGPDASGIPVFRDLAAEYGLADTTQSTMAYFFDYDNDGDLDLYIGVNHIVKDEYANIFRPRNLHGEHPSTGKLYRNDWDEKLKHPFYTDVSKAAGIQIEGYTHAADIFDANNDGWLDILVLNDYISSNVLYINNHDGTFTDHVREYFKHAAANSMGSDAVDINNDGRQDVIEVDMAPQDNLRKKMFQAPVSYQMYQNTEQFGYQYQYTRNMLQLNMGPSVGEEDTIKHPLFGEAGFFAGIAETDWSWTPLVADFDDDGNKDIIFTNGFPKDITDRDFMTYRDQAYSLTSKKDMLSEIPEVKIHNYIYQNNGKARFTDRSLDWGMEEPSFSNGAVYADLDNDGDLDVVINNINDPAMVYENRIHAAGDKDVHHLSVSFKGPEKNRNGIGAVLFLYAKGNVQMYNNNPYRGYISSQSGLLHIGLGKDPVIDSVVVTWQGGYRQRIDKPQADQLLTIDFKQASPSEAPAPVQIAADAWFTNVTGRTGINYFHQQRDYVDFNVQKLLPHKFSEYTPGIAAGDINGDGIDDFVVGGVSGYSPMLFTQQPDGKFSRSALLGTDSVTQKRSEDRGLLLFDADGDGDNDLIISAGGYQYERATSSYQDVLYVNDGKGGFAADSAALPVNYGSKYCVRASDMDQDGDLDLFIAGRVDPQTYPKPVSSFIYRNDSKPGMIRFTDVTSQVAPSLINSGLTCDAVFSDYDNDGWADLVICGEWSSIKLLHNDHGKFTDRTGQSGLEAYTGWWSSLAPGDFDNDGDIDYIAGNLGLNSFYRATEKMPLNIYAADFDGNGSYDAIPSLYLPETLLKGAQMKEFPAHGRDDMVKQMLSIRRDFTSYKAYATSTMDQILPEAKRRNAIHLSAGYLASAYLQNDGNGKFTVKPLPDLAQLSALNGMVVEDFNGDGALDVAFNTNDYGTDPTVGRYDALNGLVLKGDGKGGFEPMSMVASGICINANGKGMAKLRSADGHFLIVAASNKGPVMAFRGRATPKLVNVAADDAFGEITMRDGRRQRTEFTYGSSFLSQGSRFFVLPASATGCIITDRHGKKRTIAQ